MGHYLEEGEGVDREYEWSNVPPSVAIIETIEHYESTASDGAAGGLDTPLQQYIDADALDTAVKSDSALGFVLTFDEYIVEIDGDTVHVATA